ncbi:class I adenylate-forming enzyme family protein [Amycolatopsis sp. DSM 110486]|uniref:class I adenylate-forming enzyme family protein n=1 Tax=Amycolatopsis sp. DSM 110486 TaxID=2865832 RepID=UPI001C69B040|nr:AMP-binding protein [Amycolatopsis sp. DSM 110486]QYN16925.1 AMP-binding protein [Amycolatopsis sp. DSM 110486]
MVFPQAVLDALGSEPDAVAFEHGPRKVTRGEARDLIGRFVAALRGAGVSRGDGVGVATAVTPEGWAAQIAAQTLGCRTVGIRAGLPVAHLRTVVGDLAAVVVDEASETPELRATAAGAKILRVGPELLSVFEEPVPSGRPSDIGWVVFTSGSTGLPKGVTYSFEALTAQGIEQRPEETPADLAARYRRFLLFGTLTSAVMITHLRSCLLAGGTVVIPEALPDFPWILPRLDITAALTTVPRLYKILDVLRTSSVDVSSVRMLVVAGSPVAPGLMAEAFSRVGPGMQQAYGQTEVGKLTVLTPADVAAFPDALGSAGRPCAGVEISVRDSSGTDVEAGASGEIFVRSAGQFSGYWGNPSQTGEVLRDGWVRTQDIGHVDADGFLHLTGRTRDVVIVNAVIHYTGPIERALASHADVDQAYVVAAPDPSTGEAAHAFVVPAPGRVPDVTELRGVVAGFVGEAAASVKVIDEVPVAASGKPDEQALLKLV